MIDVVGTPVRHRKGLRRGTVAYTVNPNDFSTLVDFGRGTIVEIGDRDLDILPSYDRDVPTLTYDGEHAHISTGIRWSEDLYDIFAQQGIPCVFQPGGMGDIDVIDFRRVDEKTFDLIQRLFDRWLRAEKEYSGMSYSSLRKRRASLVGIIETGDGEVGDQAYLDAIDDEMSNRRYRLLVKVNGQTKRELGRWRTEEQCRGQIEHMGLADYDMGDDEFRYIIEGV